MYTRKAKQMVESMRSTALSGTMPLATLLGLAISGVMPTEDDMTLSIDWLLFMLSTEIIVVASG